MTIYEQSFEYLLAAKSIIATYIGFSSIINETNCGIFVNTSNFEELKKAVLRYPNMSNKARIDVCEKSRKWICKNRTYDFLSKK
nr:hypothetical protein [uncultured Flavobacterium sp.]